MKRFVLCFLTVFASLLFLTENISAFNVSDNIVTLDLFNEPYSDEFDSNCADFASALRIGGYIILIVKIVIPLVIIVKATMNMLPAITNGNPQEVKKSSTKLVYSLLSAIIIFFIPTLIYTTFGFINDSNHHLEDHEICNACVFDPFGDLCSKYVE